MSFIIEGERSFKNLYISVIRTCMFFMQTVDSLDISRSSGKLESYSLYFALRARSGNLFKDNLIVWNKSSILMDSSLIA